MEKNVTFDELLYGNLKLLSLSYPLSTELKNLLSKDMFAVANTKGFCHVIMYIFNCLNMEKYGCKLSWPIHDRASHMKFHNEVWEISKSIQADYPNADLPKVRKSFFMNPTGKKFVQYLVKLSRLVMLENSSFGKSLSAIQPKDINAVEKQLAALRFNLKENNDEFEAYMNETKIEKRNLCSSIQKHTNIVNNCNKALKKIVDKSPFDAATKERILQHDENAMKEIKGDIEEQKKRVQKYIERVKNMKSNLHELNDFIHSPQNSVCGKHLVSCLPSSIIQSISINEETGITLEDLMKVLCGSISQNKQKLLMENMSNDYPKLVALKDNLETLLGKYKNLYCEMKCFFDHMEMQILTPSNSNTEQFLENKITLKGKNLEFLNIRTPRNLNSTSSPLPRENSGLIVDWFSKESFNNRQLKLSFTPPSVDTSFISMDLSGPSTVAHKAKATYLMSTIKKRKEQKFVENKSPAKNNLVCRVLTMNSPEANKLSTVDANIKVEDSPKLPQIIMNDTDQNIEETVQKILQNAGSFSNLSDVSILTSPGLQSINESCVSDTIASEWNNDSLQRIASLMLSPETFTPVNGSSTPLCQDEPHSPVQAILSSGPKVSKMSRPSLEALRLRFLKVKESALSIPKLED